MPPSTEVPDGQSRGETRKMQDLKEISVKLELIVQAGQPGVSFGAGTRRRLNSVEDSGIQRRERGRRPEGA